MADRPIIFSGPMVRALLERRKTQTRRVLKAQPYPLEGRPGYWNASGQVGGRICISDRALLDLHHKPAPGDRLYVREAHALVGTVDPGWLLYRADGYESECIRHGFTRPLPPESAVRWRPSIHMPRWASRLTLTVTDVRVQRLQEISDADARAEGIKPSAEYPNLWERGKLSGDQNYATVTNFPKLAFRSIWEAIHGPDAWAANPWVVALTFTVHRGNIDQLVPA